MSEVALVGPDTSCQDEPQSGRHAGEGGERHGLRQNDQGADQSRREVRAHAGRGHALAPAERREKR